MKHLTTLLGVVFALCVVSGIVHSQTVGEFRTHQGGVWDSDTTWERYNGSIWVWPAAALPDTLHATTIRNGHLVTVSSIDTVGLTIIEAGGQVTVLGVPAGLFVANGLMLVHGVLMQTGASATASPYSVNLMNTGTLIIGDGGTFRQDQNLGQIPIATWSDGSTILVSGVTSGTNIGANARQSYYNIVWNCPNQTANANLGFNPTASTDTSITVRGNITVLSTGTARMYVCGPPAGTPAAHTVVRATINGNLTVLNGSIVSSNGTGSAYTDIYVTVLGNITVRDSVFLPSSIWQWSQLSISRGSQGGLGTSTWIIKSDSVTYGRKTTNSNSSDAATAITSKGKFIFCKPGIQYVTLDDSIAWSGPCNMQFGDSVTATTVYIGNSPFIGSGCVQRIKANATVVVGPNGYIGGGNNSTPLPSNFAMDIGATLVTASPNGIRATGAGSSGTVRVTGNRDYGTVSNFEYNGAVQQRLGSGFPSFARNLTINNPAGVYVDSVAAFTVNGTLAVVNGDLDLNSNTITLGPVGLLTETAGNTVVGSGGVITTTRTLTAPSSSTDIAGLGVSIGSVADLGSTVITRGHAVQTGAGAGSIKRYFDVTPATNTGLNATLVFKYDESELNSISEAGLLLFKSTDNGASWTSGAGSVNTSANTVTLSGVNDLSRWTAAGTGMTLGVSVALNWNIVSLPVASPTPDDSVKHLFTNSVNPYAFAFTGSYQQRFVMINGPGYWIKSSVAYTQDITGTPLDNLTVPVNSGWNMIGSISTAIDTSAAHVTPSVPGLRGSNYFRYSAGYVVTNTISPGLGYWVKANSAGSFLMHTTGASRPAPARSVAGRTIEDLNSITIRDANGGSQTLYFGTDSKNEIPVAMFVMPPSPPEGSFDARFRSSEGGTMVQVHSEDITTVADLPIAIQSMAYPLTVSWNVNSGTAVYELNDGVGGVHPVRGEGSIRITNSEVTTIMLRLSGNSALPKEFALSQNYPNPFNPATNITFALPVQSRVTAEIYNMLGQRVSTLIKEDRAAGFHVVEWNGTSTTGQQVGSGTYFLRLSAIGANGKAFNEVRKLMLLK